MSARYTLMSDLEEEETRPGMNTFYALTIAREMKSTLQFSNIFESARVPGLLLLAGQWRGADMCVGTCYV